MNYRNATSALDGVHHCQKIDFHPPGLYLECSGWGCNGRARGPLPSPPFPSVKSRPHKIQLGDPGERCKKLPQRGLEPSPSRQTIWCILALKSDIWWQQF